MSLDAQVRDALKRSDVWGEKEKKLTNEFLKPVLNNSKPTEGLSLETIRTLKLVCNLVTNETVTVLGDIGKPNQKASPDSATMNLIETALTCLMAMERLQSLAKDATQSFDLEKLKSNIAVRLIDFRMYPKALELLGQIHTKLQEAAAEVPAVAAPTKKAAAARTYGAKKASKEQAKENEAPEESAVAPRAKKSTQTSNYSEGTPGVPKDFQVSITDSTTKDLIALVLVMQLNVCRCWSESNSDDQVFALVQAPGGPVAWLSLLASTDPQNAQKRADIFFRLVLKAVAKVAQGFTALLAPAVSGSEALKQGIVDIRRLTEASKLTRELIRFEVSLPEQHSKLSKVHKYFDGCRLASKRLSDTKGPLSPAEWFPVQQNFAHEVSAVIDTGMAVEEYLKIPLEAAKFKLGKKWLIEHCEYLAQLAFDSNRPDTYKLSEKYLNKAMKIIMDCDRDPLALLALLDETKWISTSYYNMGVAFHQKGLFKEAVAPLSGACRLAQLLPSPALNRWEVLSLSQQKSGNIEGAVRSLIELVAVIFSRGPRGSLTMAERNSKMNTLLERILGLFMEGSRKGLKLPSFAAMLQENEVTKQDQIVRILESCCLSITPGSPEALQVKLDLIDVILEKTDENKFPQRRARILADKARTLIARGESAEVVGELKARVIALLQKSGSKEEDPRTRLDVAAKTCSSLVTLGEGALKGKLMKMWADLMAKLDQKDAVACFEDLDDTYAHLALMAEYFGLQGYFSDQHQLYQWMLQLNSQLRTFGKSALDSCFVLINLGHICSRHLNNTDEARNYFQQAQESLRGLAEGVPIELSFLFYLYMGHFHSLQNDFAAADHFFQLAEGENLSDVKPGDAYPLSSSVPSGKKTEYLLSSQRLLMCIPLLLSQGRYGTALHNGKKALAIVTKLAESPANSEDKSQSKHQLGKFSQWTLCQLFIDSLRSLGEVSELCGNIPAADYYYTQGVEFGESCSLFSLASFVSSLANFELKRERTEEASKHFKRLDSLKVPSNQANTTRELTLSRNSGSLPPMEYNRGSPDQLHKFFLDKAQLDSPAEQRALYFALSTGICCRRQMSTAISLKLENTPGETERKLAALYAQESLLSVDNFFESCVDILPPGWTVCCLNLTDDKSELFATRLRAKESPLILQSQPESVQELLDEFEEIMVGNKETTSATCTKACKTKEDKIAWWSKRNSLDERLQNLLEDLEATMLGGLEAALEENAGGHTILILDKHLQSLPWESIPSLRSRSVSRMPSLSFLRDRLVALKPGAAAAAEKPRPAPPAPKQAPAKSKKGKEPAIKSAPAHSGLDLSVDCSKTFFVLNPSKDLVATQDNFEKTFKREKSWKGIVAREPTQDEFVDALTQNDLFIYCGHGGGEQYVKPERLDKLTRCAVSLLIGCSSGHLKKNGVFDPSGTALHYIYAGCPAFVANLWDVTDKDIDLFTHSLMDSWGVFSAPAHGTKHLSLCKAVATARDQCTLKYLNGAAPIVYGLPVVTATREA